MLTYQLCCFRLKQTSWLNIAVLIGVLSKKIIFKCFKVQFKTTTVNKNDVYLQTNSIFHTHTCTGLFKMIFGVIHNTLQMQPHVIYFCEVMSRIRFMFLLFPQVSRNWRYESEPPLKPSPLTCGTNSIIVLMFVEAQRVQHIEHLYGM